VFCAKEINQQINLEELSKMIGIVGGESTTKNYSMKFIFIVWIVCCLPTIKNIELERIDQFLGLVSRIIVGLFGSA
jgi:hypothetical protein